jgi:FkbM family methyltransferase
MLFGLLKDILNGKSWTLLDDASHQPAAQADAFEPIAATSDASPGGNDVAQDMIHEEVSRIGVVFDTPQGIFCLDPRDKFVGESLIKTGRYGEQELERIASFVTKEDSVLIVGAHIGSLAIPLSKRVAKLTAIEANPVTYRMLEINKRLNACTNVEIFHAAANHEPGEIEFVMNTVNSGGSKRMPLYRDELYFYDDPEVQRVPAVVLDDVLRGKRFDLILMDIEGSEYFAMLGMTELLSHARVVICEFIPHLLTRVAGIGVKEFLSPLREFQTMIVPVLSKYYHGANIESVLVEMFQHGYSDDGIIFLRDNVDFEQAGTNT